MSLLQSTVSVSSASIYFDFFSCWIALYADLFTLSLLRPIFRYFSLIVFAVLRLFLLFSLNRISVKSNLSSGSTWTLEVVSIGSCSNRISSVSISDLILSTKSRISCWSLSLNKSSSVNMSSVVMASPIYCLLSGSPFTSLNNLS